MDNITNYTKDKFLGGKILISQPINGFRTSIDSIFLSAAVNLKKNNSILELGCGVGTILCSLKQRENNISVFGVELQKKYAEFAKKNLKDNNFEGKIFNSDIINLPNEVLKKSFDHIIFNPPYLKKDIVLENTINEKKISIKESEVLLDDWIKIALKRCVNGGYINFVHRAERLSEILYLIGDKAGCIKILPIFSKRNKNSNRIIITAKKGSKSNLIIMPPLVVHKTKKKKYTKIAKDILYKGKIIS